MIQKRIAGESRVNRWLQPMRPFSASRAVHIMLILAVVIMAAIFETRPSKAINWYFVTVRIAGVYPNVGTRVFASGYLMGTVYGEGVFTFNTTYGPVISVDAYTPDGYPYYGLPYYSYPGASWPLRSKRSGFHLSGQLSEQYLQTRPFLPLYLLDMIRCSSFMSSQTEETLREPVGILLERSHGLGSRRQSKKVEAQDIDSTNGLADTRETARTTLQVLFSWIRRKLSRQSGSHSIDLS